MTEHLVNLTRSERRLFDTLSDGDWHQREPLVAAVTGRRHASKPLIAVHILKLRRKIAAAGYQIEASHDPSRGGWRLLQPGSAVHG